MGEVTVGQVQYFAAANQSQDSRELVPRQIETRHGGRIIATEVDDASTHLVALANIV